MAQSGGHLVVAGATSVATQHLVEIARGTPGWRVTGLSHRPPSEAAPAVRYIAVDLLDADACRAALAETDCTHLVYAARASHALYTAMAPYAKVGIEDVEPNVAMLRNIVAAAQNPALRHVHAVAGTKWYGLHLGPFTTPARESDPGHLPPNFYFDQQDLLIAAAARHGWSWSTSRPGVISGIAVGMAPNLLSTIGAYAAICRHLGRPFDFPGRPGAYTALQELTDAGLLARAIFWMCGAPEARNRAFNVTNGDLFRWEQVWPRLAAHFGLEKGRVRHVSLVQWMADKSGVWDEIVATHGLQPLPIAKVASWGFADFCLGWDYDVISSATRIRQAGFHDIIDTEEMMLAQIGEYQARRILPTTTR